jgi:hypothetical protein
MGLDLDQARRRAKDLLRDARAGDAHALSRLRGDRTPRLADAQAAVARELGFPSWPRLVSAVAAGEDQLVAALLDAGVSPGALERIPHGHAAEVIRDTGLEYVPGRPIRVRLWVRDARVDVDDMGGAIAVAGTPPGWRQAAEAAVDQLGWNMRRNGVVCMQAPRGRRLAWIIQRTAIASAAVCEAILQLDD